jgi:hypothetical protein
MGDGGGGRDGWMKEEEEGAWLGECVCVDGGGWGQRQA